MSNRWNVTIGRASVAAAFLAAAACGGRQPDTPEARFNHGLDIVNAVGRHVAEAQTVSFTTHEKGERVRRSGRKDPVSIQQEVRVRRPDRLHLKGSGNLDLEVVYDGKQITLLSHKEKVYGVVPASGPLTEVIPGVIDRFDIPFPVGDLIAFTAAERLVNEETTGGWVGDETLNDQAVSKVAWQHPNLDWTIWVAKDGPPLLQRMEIHFKGRRGSPRRTYEFTNWVLNGEIPEATFAANVPQDYEGIPVIQRASAVLPADAQPTAEPAAAGSQKEPRKE
jgi:hypothetical protein